MCACVQGLNYWVLNKLCCLHIRIKVLENVLEDPLMTWKDNQDIVNEKKVTKWYVQFNSILIKIIYNMYLQKKKNDPTVYNDLSVQHYGGCGLLCAFPTSLPLPQISHNMHVLFFIKKKNLKIHQDVILPMNLANVISKDNTQYW